MEDYLKIQTHSKIIGRGDDTGGKFYREFMSVLYFSPSYEILSLCEELEEQYAKLQVPSYLRRDSYCNDQAVLHYLLTNIDKHIAGAIPPLECLPNEDDFKQHVEYLKTDYNNTGMAFVAHNLLYTAVYLKF